VAHLVGEAAEALRVEKGLQRVRVRVRVRARARVRVRVRVRVQPV